MSASPRAKFEELIVELHREMRAGRSKGEKLDQIDAEMDRLWPTLSSEDRGLIQDLSADLYIIEKKRRIVPLAEGETLEEVREKLSFAEDREALALLRKLPELGLRDIYALGRCWEGLGFHLGAVCLYDFAFEQDPQPWLEASTLVALERGGWLDKAMERAQEIESRPFVSASVVMQVMRLLQQVATRTTPAEQRALHERATKLAERAWNDPDALAIIRAACLLAAGISYVVLRKESDALRVFDLAVKENASEIPLLMRGLALEGVDKAQAIRDFTEAARQRTQRDWPYLYAAHHALEEGRFAEVEGFCEEGIRRTTRSDWRGRLFEWWAIAASILGRSPRQVHALFHQATAELPLDLRIRSNAKRYRDAIAESRELRVADYEVSKEPPQVDLADARRSLSLAA